MNLRKTLVTMLFLSICAVVASSAQRTPKVALSATRVPIPGRIMVRGSGFTAKRNVTSHLLRPDGTEFPVLPILTNDHGEFSHEIDTLLLSTGTHELWVVDDTSRASSNRVQFEVTMDQPLTR